MFKFYVSYKCSDIEKPVRDCIIIASDSVEASNTLKMALQEIGLDLKEFRVTERIKSRFGNGFVIV